MKTVDLAELTGRGEVRNLAGHERGVAARKKFKLDEADKNEEPVEVIVPEYLYAISPSFFQGLLAESVKLAGSRADFEKRYKFKARELVMRQIDEWIDISLSRRRGIFASL